MKLKTIEYLRENKIEYYLCRICSQIVSKEHFNTESHIKLFNSSYDIEIKKSFKNTFISIKCQFIDSRYNYIYTDLHFKKHIKEKILKNTDETKYYKAYIIKKNMLDFKYEAELQYYSEKYNCDDIINSINNIENLEKNDEYLKPHLIKNNTTD